MSEEEVQDQSAVEADQEEAQDFQRQLQAERAMERANAGSFDDEDQTDKDLEGEGDDELEPEEDAEDSAESADNDKPGQEAYMFFFIFAVVFDALSLIPFVSILLSVLFGLLSWQFLGSGKRKQAKIVAVGVSMVAEAALGSFVFFFPGFIIEVLAMWMLDYGEGLPIVGSVVSKLKQKGLQKFIGRGRSGGSR